MNGLRRYSALPDCSAGPAPEERAERGEAPARHRPEMAGAAPWALPARRLQPAGAPPRARGPLATAEQARHAPPRGRGAAGRLSGPAEVSAMCAVESGGEGNCQRLCCARFACSWCCKVGMLCIVCKCMLLVGPLSQPMWMPISYGAACEEVAGDEEAPERLAQQHDHDLDSCRRLCQRTQHCVAVDVFNASSVCNLYARPCLAPAAVWDQASSWQIARYCSMSNGTQGYVIGGECNTSIQPPSWSVLVKQGIWMMALSPVSWVVSLFVALVYAYVSSIWFRRIVQMCKDLELGGCCTKACGRAMCSVALQASLVLIGWAVLSRCYFGWPVLLHPQAAPPMISAPVMGIQLPAWPPSQWAFNLASLLVLCLVFPPVRRRILEDVIPQILVLLVAWAAASSWLTGWPDFYSWPPRPPPTKVDPLLGVVPKLPPAAWALDLLALSLLVLIVCPCLRVYVAEAVAGIGVLVMACFNGLASAVFGAATGVETLAGTAAAVAGAEGAAGALANAALAMETGASAAAAALDSAVATEAAAAADAVTAFLATVESAVAAEAAASSAAAVAAAQAASTGMHLSLCNIM